MYKLTFNQLYNLYCMINRAHFKSICDFGWCSPQELKIWEKQQQIFRKIALR